MAYRLAKPDLLFIFSFDLNLANTKWCKKPEKVTKIKNSKFQINYFDLIQIILSKEHLAYYE